MQKVFIFIGGFIMGVVSCLGFSILCSKQLGDKMQEDMEDIEEYDF